ncbi:MAG TPA: hypothetical protein VIH96_07470 [Paraburkholderia sp.]
MRNLFLDFIDAAADGATAEATDAPAHELLAAAWFAAAIALPFANRHAEAVAP